MIRTYPPSVHPDLAARIHAGGAVAWTELGGSRLEQAAVWAALRRLGHEIQPTGRGPAPSTLATALATATVVLEVRGVFTGKAGGRPRADRDPDTIHYITRRRLEGAAYQQIADELTDRTGQQWHHNQVARIWRYQQEHNP